MKNSILDSLETNKVRISTKTYQVEITETLQLTISVDAKSAVEAEDIVRAGYRNSDYVLDAQNHIGTDFKVFEHERAHKPKRDSLLL